MRWLVAFGCGGVCAVIGGVVAAQLTERYVEWYRAVSFRGRDGMMMIYLPLLGAMVGMVLGAVGAWIFGRVHAWQGMGAGVGLVLGTALLGWGALRVGADVAPGWQGDRVALQFEIRMPEGWEPGRSMVGGRSRVELQGGSRVFETEPVIWSQAARSQGRLTVAGKIRLSSSRRDLQLVLDLAGERFLRFRLPVFGGIGPAEELFSGWLMAEGEKAGGVEYRFRLEREAVPPEK